jgi:RHS repeat-associated protein
VSCDVNIATGEVFQDGVDVDLPGIFELSFVRSYSTTRSHRRGGLGFGWGHDLDTWLELTAEGFTLHEGDAATPGRWDGRHDDGRPHAAREGDIVSLFGANGSVRQFTHVLPDNRRMFLIVMRDVYGNALQYRYDQRARLTSVTSPEGRVLRFTYGPGGLLAAIAVSHDSVQPEPLTLVRYEYDHHGDLVSVTDQRGFAERYRYVDHLIVAHANRLGGRTYYAYDTSRRCCASWQDGERNIRLLDYDAVRHATFVADSYGQRILQRLDEAGQIVAQVDPLGHVTESVYDDQGRHIAMFDELGLVGESETFDPQLRQRRDYNGAGEVVIVQLDTQGRVVRRGCPVGEQLVYTYDEHGGIASIRTQDDYGWDFEYDRQGRLIHAVDTLGYSLRQEFLRQGFEIRLSDPFGLLERREFDVLGNVVRYGAADRFAMVTSYEAQDCPVSERFPDGRSNLYEYDAELHLVQASDPLRRTERFEYDAFGMIVVEEDPLGGRVRFEYDREYRLSRVTNQKGQQFEFTYDALGNEVSRRFFENDVQQSTYDARGRRRTVVDAIGGVTMFDYDGGDRIVRRVLPDGTRHELERDEAGRVVAVVETRVVDDVVVERRLTLAYGTSDLCLREEQDDRWIEFDYDPAGHVTGVRDSWGGATIYRRGRRYNVEAIEEAGRTFGISWNDGDYLSEIRYPNGMRQTFTIDAYGRLLVRAMLAADGRVLAQRDFQYDQASQVIGFTDSHDGTRRFTYDRAGRLTQVTDGSGMLLEQYAYDHDDNLVRSHRGAGTIGAGDQVTASGRWTYAYDATGKLRVRNDATDRWELDFDADEQLVRVRHDDATVATYSYDVLGRRTGKTTEAGEHAFLYDGFTALRAERLGSRLVRYVYIPGLDVPIACYVGDEWFYYSLDQLGMPTEVWDDQRLRGRVRAEAYGQGREVRDLAGAAPPLPYLFPGQYYDEETGFCYNVFRYYCPDAASYLTRDMLSMDAQPNHYAYPRDPLMSADPDGLMPTQIKFECNNSKECNWDKMPCAKRIARLKVAKLNREAKKRQLKKCSDCARTKQRKYYNDTCGGNAPSTHQVDHFHELQGGGPDKCCRNLVAIPSLINNCLGKMISGRTDQVAKITFGLKAVNAIIAKGTRIGHSGCGDTKNTAKCTKAQWKDAYKRAPKQDCENPKSVC